jgi:hypothetical protein
MFIPDTNYFYPDPGSANFYPSRIPDPEVKKVPDPQHCQKWKNVYSCKKIHTKMGSTILVKILLFLMASRKPLPKRAGSGARPGSKSVTCDCHGSGTLLTVYFVLELLLKVLINEK